jgi:hypothetical protein
MGDDSKRRKENKTKEENMIRKRTRFGKRMR